MLTHFNNLKGSFPMGTFTFNTLGDRCWLKHVQPYILGLVLKHALPSKKTITSTSGAGECLWRASLCSSASLLGAAASDVGRQSTGRRNVWLRIPARACIRQEAGATAAVNNDVRERACVCVGTWQL